MPYILTKQNSKVTVLHKLQKDINLPNTLVKGDFNTILKYCQNNLEQAKDNDEIETLKYVSFIQTKNKWIAIKKPALNKSIKYSYILYPTYPEDKVFLPSNADDGNCLEGGLLNLLIYIKNKEN